MRSEFNKIGGRIGVVAALLLVVAALALYFYSERAVPPETGSDLPVEVESDAARQRPDSPVRRPSGQSQVGATANGSPEGDADTPTADRPAGWAPDVSASEAATAPEPEISLERQQRLLREDLAVRLGPGQIEMIVEEQLLERLVTTVNSLDDAPVPLRFRPLVHVPDLPRLDEDGDDLRLPATPDPRYRPFRVMFDRLDVVELAELFDRYEPALEKAWQALGEHAGQTFRQRSIEILEHLAEFELPASRPALHQPEVLYEYIDPSLEQLSWGRKILVRIGPEHAPQVQRKLAALAQRLASRSRQTEQGTTR